MLFLSRLPRWLLSLAAFVGGLVLVFGDSAKWRSTPSLKWLGNAVPFVPLQVYGVALAVAGVLLLRVRTRPLGYALNAGLFTLATVSLLVTVHQSGPKAILFIVACVQVVAFSILALDISADARKDEEVPGCSSST